MRVHRVEVDRKDAFIVMKEPQSHSCNILAISMLTFGSLKLRIGLDLDPSASTVSVPELFSLLNTICVDTWLSSVADTTVARFGRPSSDRSFARRPSTTLLTVMCI